MKVKYYCTMTIALDIDADNKKTAEYLSRKAVPVFIELSSYGVDGSGTIKFNKLLDLQVTKEEGID